MSKNPSQGNLPLVTIENTGGNQKNVPFTFGQVFAIGHMQPSDGLAAVLPNGSRLALQVDVKATHAEGSVRHAIISGVLPDILAGEVHAIRLEKAEKAKIKFDSGAKISDGVVELTIGGVKYTTQGSIAREMREWLSGQFVAEASLPAQLRDSSGNVHPHLTVIAGVRAYSTGHVRVEVIVENTKTFTPGAQNFVYDVAVKIGGKTVYEQKALKHYHHARWRKLLWIGQEPQIHIVTDKAYLIASRAVSNYDQTVHPGEKAVTEVAKRVSAANTGPMTIGPLKAYMPTTGGRPDIGPLPEWSVTYLLTGDKRALDTMVAAAEGSGSWSIHMRDENTGYPLRVDNEKNKTISTHMNLAHKGPLPVPRYAKGADSSTPYSDDTAHQPSLVYLPYLLTGDYYYLEELQFWAASNPLATDPNNSGLGQGLVRWQQVRGQAWSLRTLGHAAYITPDDHPLKDYFVKQVENNLNFYHQTYVVGNPNALGAYDGSGSNAFSVNASAPWQDDFLTWSFGHLAELGFEKAMPILEWKAKYAIGRMTDPGFCWIQASAYHLEFKPDGKSPVYGSFSDLYKRNFSGNTIWVEGGQKPHPKGENYIQHACGSQGQIDWLSATAGFKWQADQMIGYAGSPTGYPANLQPALAISATFGIKGAKEAWERFYSRSAKPDYSTGPQFAIVPREKEAIPIEEPITVEVSPVVVDGSLAIFDSEIKANQSYTIVVLHNGKELVGVYTS